ncbi:amidohydrolase AmhX [Sporolactobacillus putidus]|uniref:Amidohydrolase AmhX n=1 Tax=Sporolactobacillus putidus TaxID=492735 RepID=A0A917S7G1_9BACL|nr:M20 peptidase aminoacylase family protein [Sporolactobacillus putidus]GGL59586.1 amidohydrolase AmhX [Sporolactobacillus putidus]
MTLSDIPHCDETIQEKIREIFDYLHTHAEISMKETATTEWIRNRLDALGCRTRTFTDCPGVIGEIGSGKPVVAIRADMDALWQEVGGTFRANHSCGHDAHMSMVLGVLMLLKKCRSMPEGTIRFVFQPGEETGEGARAMVARGVMNDADYLFGVHLRPNEEIPDGRAEPAILHGACKTISGVIRGEAAHAARPHLGKNAIEAATAIVEELGHIHINPMIPSTVKMTTLHSGTASNIIPGYAEFTLDVRAQTNEAMTELIEHVQRVIQSVADVFSVQIEIKISPGCTSALYHQEAIDIMADAITEVLGKTRLEAPHRSSGGDDFHQYALNLPNLKTTMLGLGCGLKPGLHHPQMTFNRDAMYSGSSILTAAVLRALGKGAGD